jgi:beta-hydroxylase
MMILGWLRQLLRIAKRILLKSHHWMIWKSCSDANREFFDTEDFPWIAELESNWKLIRSDVDHALRSRDKIPSFTDVDKYEVLIANHKWKTLFFWIWGEPVIETCELYPNTAGLLDKIPNMTTAMFSILDGDVRIPPHVGPFKGVLRYHLGLSVPASDERCSIRVGNEVRTWQEGRSLVFDDTFEHEAWNLTQRHRVVLFVDFMRPMPWHLAALNRLILRLTMNFSPYVIEWREKARKYARELKRA